jgi:diguanylate cyclase (GGDEF)-like protein
VGPLRFPPDAVLGPASRLSRPAAALDRRPLLAAAVPVAVSAVLLALAALTGGADSAVEPLLGVPLLLAAAFLSWPWWLPALGAHVLSSAVLLADHGDHRANHIATMVVWIALAALVAAGAAHVARIAGAARLGTAIASAPHASAVARALEEHLLRGDVVAAAVAVADDVPPSLVEAVAEVGAGADNGGRTFRVRPLDAFARALAGGPLAVGPDAASEDTGARIAAERGYGSTAVLPLGGGDHGTMLVLSTHRRGAFSRRRLASLQRRYAPLAEAISAHLLRCEHERRLLAAERGRELSRALAAAPDVDGVFTAAARGVAALTGADGVEVVVRDPERRELLVCRAASGPSATRGDVDTSAEPSALHAAMVRDEPLWIPDRPRSRIVQPGPRPVESALYLPLRVGDDVRGGFTVLFAEPRIMPRDEIDLVSSVAAEIGAAWQRAEAEERLREQASRDGLTGLLNHAAFHDRLTAATRSPVRGGRPVALVLADLDHLKHTNDTYGHGVGDAALRAVAAALANAARTGDAIGRVGGDEFAWLLAAATPDDALAAAARVVEAVNRIIVEPAGALSLSAGVAVAMAPTDPDRLLERADRSLMDAKARGRGVASLAREGDPLPGAAPVVGLPEPPAEGFAGAADAARWLAREWTALFRATAAAVLLLEDGGAALRAVAFHERGRDDWPLSEDAYRLEEYPATARALETGEVYACRDDDPLADPAEIREVRRDGFRSMMIVPIRAGSRAVGAIEIFDARARTFASDERRLGVGLGRHAALLLEGLPR